MSADAAPVVETVTAPYALECAECGSPSGEPCRAGCSGELWSTGDPHGSVVWLSRAGVPHWLPRAGALCATCGRLHGPEADR